VSCATTAEPIKMPFGMCTQMGSCNHMLDAGEGNFDGDNGLAQDMPTGGALDGVHIGEYN